MKNWKKEKSFHCPVCGTKEGIYINELKDDYYLGPPYLCTNCNTWFYVSTMDLDESDKELAKKLKENK